jgi:hypothetical protein
VLETSTDVSDCARTCATTCMSQVYGVLRRQSDELLYHLAVVQANRAFSDGAQERALTIVNPIYLARLATGANSGCYRVSHLYE